MKRPVAIICLFLSVIIMLSLITFSPYDPSLFTFSTKTLPIQNLIGFFGSYVSSSLIFLFGWSGFLIPVCLSYFSIKLFKEEKIEKKSIGKSFGLILCTTIILYLIKPTTLINGITLPSAGALGTLIAGYLKTYLGVTGTILLLVTTAILISSKTFKKVAEKIDTPISLPKIKPALNYMIPSVPKKRIRPAVSKVLSYVPPFPEEIFLSDSHDKVITNPSEYKDTSASLEQTFLDFGINGKVDAIQPGPVVTVYEFVPDAGTKIAKILGLIDDLALALKVDSILMQPVVGKRAIGIQVPNKIKQMVRFGDLLKSEKFEESESPLTLALGKSISGEPVISDLAKMPHLLLAGATGSGKSVAVNALLCSIIMKASPKEVRMILVDPKMLELSVYGGIPHLLMPVITEPQKASLALKWAVKEMEDRYKLMQHAKVRNIESFNSFWKNADETTKSDIKEITALETIEELPLILLVIDELADLMMTAPKDVESYIQRLAQKARASGIHLILATQRPSVDIITGVIKANLPSRIAFQVVAKHDSRTILDQMGADKLLGNGDMLFQQPGATKLKRIQGSFISDDEVNRLVKVIKESSTLVYNQELMQWIDTEASRGGSDASGHDDTDPKYADAVEIASRNGAVSASFLQRQLKIGYNRAARIVESMEAHGLVDKAEAAGKPRKWLG